MEQQALALGDAAGRQEALVLEPLREYVLYSDCLRVSAGCIWSCVCVCVFEICAWSSAWIDVSVYLGLFVRVCACLGQSAHVFLRWRPHWRCPFYSMPDIASLLAHWPPVSLPLPLPSLTHLSLVSPPPPSVTHISRCPPPPVSLSLSHTSLAGQPPPTHTPLHTLQSL